MKMYKSKVTILLAAFGLLAATLINQSLAENTIDITTDENVLSIHADQSSLLLYRYNNVPFKPYIQQLFSPSGVNILRDAPHDHLHHHALMFAVKVDGVNFWEETPTAGKQLHKSFTNVTSKVKTDTENDKHNEVHQAAFTELIDWNNSSGQFLLKEKRTVEVYRTTGINATLLTWKSELELPEGVESVTLKGAHYHGLGMRFLTSMDTGGQFINADNKTGTVFRGQERLLRSTWCAYTANADGKPVTVAMFDHPNNTRHPATWFTMTEPFAYLSATMNLHVEPLKVVTGKPLVLKYAVVLWDGKVESDRINKLYKSWSAE
jgi:hypothetical protein